MIGYILANNLPKKIVSDLENPEHFQDLYDLLDKTSQDLISLTLVGNFEKKIKNLYKIPSIRIYEKCLARFL